MKNTMSSSPKQSHLISRFLGLVSATALATHSLVNKVAAGTTDVFGKIEPPAGVDKYNGPTNNIGIILFFSNIIRFATVIAGIWVFINFIMAGWIYITSSGDSGAHKKVSEKLTMSVMGIMIIVGAYTIAALLGLIIFGDAKYILSPTLKGIQ